MGKTVIFRIDGQSVPVTSSDLRHAMVVFDRDFRNRAPSVGTGYYVEHKDLAYPPKAILRLALAEILRSKPGGFHGGEKTNTVFEQLGFEVRKLTRKLRETRTEWLSTCPSPDWLVSEIFRSKWSHLHGDSGVQLPDCVGIYVLSLTNKQLEGCTVSEDEVFYVGMSNHAGVRTRLRQFKKGIEDGQHHSAAKHFFKRWTQGAGYQNWTHHHPQRFYVATASIPCKTKAGIRTPLDLRKMGVIASVECEVLARVLEKCGKEPPLNRQ